MAFFDFVFVFYFFVFFFNDTATTEIYTLSLHDALPIYVKDFLKSTGIKDCPTSFRSPWQNPYVERFIGTLRRDLLDHVIIFNEQQLHYLLKEYINDY